MNKSRKGKGKASVTFILDPGVGAQTAAVCGEWNDWSAGADVMRRDAEGGFSLTVDLDAGRAYRFRYLLDGERWENDWAADAYLPNSFGGDNSVIDLTALDQAAPPAAKKAPAGEGTGREGTGREGTGGEGTRGEGTRGEGTGREGTGREGTRREGTRREGTRREGTRREGTRREGTGEDHGESRRGRDEAS